MVTLYRGGGLYMDLDFITLQPLDETLLWNFFPFPKEDRSRVTNSMFHLQHGHRFIDEIVHRLAINYYPDKYDEHGPVVNTKVMSEVCGFKPGDYSVNKIVCKDVNILSHKLFYPIPFKNWQDYFREVDEEKLSLIKSQSYAVHVWNKASSKATLTKGSNQLYMKLAQENCPFAFYVFSDFD